MIKLFISLIVTGFVVFPRTVRAVIPPDFIFNIGTQIAQFFSLIVIFCTAIFGAFFQFFRTKFYAIKYKKLVIIACVIFVVALSLISSYFYAIYKQKSEYQKWLNESKNFNSAKDYTDETDMSVVNPPILENADANDQLNVGGDIESTIDTSSNKFVSLIETSDNAGRFITDYYSNIANGNLDRAYEMSKKSVNFNTFQGWYRDTTKITLNKLVRIDQKKSSVELTLYEGNKFTRYGVLITLFFQEQTPQFIEKSEVKTLASGMIENDNANINEDIIAQEYGFFVANENKNIIITNDEFKKVTDYVNEDYIVLDARENIEYENGYFPESIHIRFADLKAGRWIELPKEKFIYVICWSGIRGKEVAEFLRTKKIVASYLEKGANGWVEFGGKWIGSIKFGDKYNDERYQIVFTSDEVREKQHEGVILVDTREPQAFQKWHIVGSINIPIMYTPSVSIESSFDKVPGGSKIITVCDGYVNCFDAKVTGIELERRGHQFLGRYNKPWEYEK